MADLTELKNLIRIGTVQSVDNGKMTARVKFDDKGGIISGGLHIIKRPVHVIPEPKSKISGQTATTEGHFHKAYITDWVPEVGQMVLCIMLADGGGDGFVIGGV